MKDLFTGLWLLLLTLVAVGSTLAAPHLVDEVRPFVGTQGEGNTYPGAVAPFGMLQLSPDTDDSLWETASGYEYTDSSIIGFSLTHLEGTGMPDLGDFVFMPGVGAPKFVPGAKAHPDSGYRSPFSHADETASPGYYRVRLQKHDVMAELTAADRSGMLRFTFPQTDSAYILTDLHHVLRWWVIWSNVRVLNDSTVTGYHLANGWAASGISISPPGTHGPSTITASCATANRSVQRLPLSQPGGSVGQGACNSSPATRLAQMSR